MTERHPVLANLSVAVQALENASLFLLDEQNADDVALCLYDMAAVKRLAGRVFSDMERHYLSLCTEQKDRKREVPGVGLVEVKKSTRYRAWQNDELLKRVVALALDERRVDVETGEYEREADAVARVLAECARPDWRLTPLRARHIDVSEFCEVEVDGYSVKLPAPSEPALSEGEAAA